MLEDPLILIHQGKISNMQEFLPCWRRCCSPRSHCSSSLRTLRAKPSTLVVNKLRGTLNAVAVKAPGFGDRRKAMLEDIATLTGATVITQDLGLKLDQVGLDDLGTARRVTVTKDETTIVDGAGSKDDVDSRVALIKSQVEASDSEWDREKLQERLAKLAGGVSVIRVGAATEVELKGASTGLRTPCPPPVPLWRKALLLVAVPPSSTLSPSWTRMPTSPH